MNQNFYEPNLCYDSISSGFDQSQPPQFFVIHQPPQETSVEILHDHENNRPAFYNYDDDDDNEEYTIAITPEEPDNSLSKRDEHFDTILATKSNEVIKSSIEDLVPILSESEGIPDNILDRDIEDDILREKLLNIHLLIAKIESLNDNPTPDRVLKSPSPFPIPGKLTSVVMEDNLGEPRVYVPNVLPTHTTLMLDTDFIPSDNSLPESEIFCFDIEEKNSGSTTIYADISLSVFDHFHFKIKPDTGDLTFIIDPEIRKNVSSMTNVNLPFEDDWSPLFAYVVWIFLSFLTYLVAPPYLLSSGNEDTIFYSSISIYHSLFPGVSHRNGTFMKFNVYPNHLKIEILSSTCFPMDQ
nr:hypothetical protein [Tanacetum cinerariifolium]